MKINAPWASVRRSVPSIWKACPSINLRVRHHTWTARTQHQELYRKRHGHDHQCRLAGFCRNFCRHSRWTHGRFGGRVVRGAEQIRLLGRIAGTAFPVNRSDSYRRSDQWSIHCGVPGQLRHCLGHGVGDWATGRRKIVLQPGHAGHECQFRQCRLHGHSSVRGCLWEREYRAGPIGDGNDVGHFRTHCNCCSGNRGQHPPWANAGHPTRRSCLGQKSAPCLFSRRVGRCTFRCDVSSSDYSPARHTRGISQPLCARRHWPIHCK